MGFETLIATVANFAKVPASLLLAICTYESNLKNVMVPYDGDSPTYGICQVKFDTAKMMGFTGKEDDLMIPEINVKWAAEYLKYQLNRYEGDWCKSTAAYNSGTYRESKISPGYPMNLKYVRRVQKKLDKSLQYRLSCQ